MNDMTGPGRGGNRSNAGAKKKIFLSDRQEDYIRSNYNRMTQQEIADALSLNKCHIIKYMMENNLERVIKHKASIPFNNVNEGIFNVHSMENWVI